MIELQLIFSCYKLKDRNHQAVSISYYILLPTDLYTHMHTHTPFNHYLTIITFWNKTNIKSRCWCDCSQPTRNSADTNTNQEINYFLWQTYRTNNYWVVFTFFKAWMIRMPIKPDLNSLSFVFRAKWGWMDRCVTFAHNRWGIVLWTLLSDTHLQAGTSEEQLACQMPQ